MKVHEQISSFETVEAKSSRSRFFAGIARLHSGVADWIETAAGYYAAAAMYEQLSNLSDTELKRRGLSRENLARDVIATCDRAALSAIDSGKADIPRS